MPKRSKEEIDYFKIVGQRIKKIRLDHGMKQTKLADAIDMEQPNMGRIEAGGVNLTLLTLKRIADALNTTVSKLVENE